MLSEIRVLIYGVGPIGSLIAKAALEKPGLRVVGAIDIDPKKVGRDLGEFLGLTEKLGVVISKDAEETLKEVKPDVVLHATGSYLDKIYPELVGAMEVGADVISSCETLSYPWYRYPELSKRLDEEAKRRGVTILGTGVNPGYRLDSLLAFLTAVCVNVRGIRAYVYLDAAKRRYSFQRKIGLGLSPQEFKEKLMKGELTAHVGYAESVLLTALIMGVKLDRVEEEQEPLIANRPLKTEYFNIKPGQVYGVSGYGVGYRGNEKFIEIGFTAAVGVREYEDVVIDGEPNVHWRNEEPFIAGDIATAAMILNSIPRVLIAKPGLITMRDLILPAAVIGNMAEWGTSR
ncbi:MAG: hypothetical protein QXQ28_05245 [Candidatus Nezhaarchaeales archaeon]